MGGLELVTFRCEVTPGSTCNVPATRAEDLPGSSLAPGHLYANSHAQRHSDMLAYRHAQTSTEAHRHA